MQPEADPTAPPREEHLAPGRFVDSDHPDVVAFARETTAGAADDHERVARLFAVVRDRIRYDPYDFADDPARYTASAVLHRDSAFCIPKATLLAASARAVGVPARLGFSDVRNHLSSPKLREQMGTDLFRWHGYAELHVGGAWRKATPAFNAELCARFGVAPLEFDGTADAQLHAFTGDGSRHMEYVREIGSYLDVPYDEMVGELLAAYPGFRGRADDEAFAAGGA